MSDQDESAVQAHMAENELWTRAEERAIEARSEAVRQYAEKLLADPARMANALYERMASTTPEADRLCQTVARMLVYGESPAALLAAIAAEEADDVVPYVAPETMMDDDGDNDE